MTKRYLAMAIGSMFLGATLSCSSSEPTTPPVDSGVFGQIELVELTGHYALGDPDSSRVAAFPFPANIASFRELRLVVSGAWSVGTMEITHQLGFTDTVAFHVSLSVQLENAAAPADTFVAAVTPLDGDFWRSDVFLACCPRSGLDPGSLLEADLTAEMSFVYDVPPNARVLDSPEGQITGVRLEAVDAVRAEWPLGGGFP